MNEEVHSPHLFPCSNAAVAAAAGRGRTLCSVVNTQSPCIDCCCSYNTDTEGRRGGEAQQILLVLLLKPSTVLKMSCLLDSKAEARMSERHNHLQPFSFLDISVAEGRRGGALLPLEFYF